MLMMLAEERAMRVEAEKMSFMVVVVGLIFSVVFLVEFEVEAAFLLFFFFCC